MSLLTSHVEGSGLLICMVALVALGAWFRWRASISSC
jgi:phosphoglycerate-specific signal transduction histidine kinase